MKYYSTTLFCLIAPFLTNVLQAGPNSAPVQKGTSTVTQTPAGHGSSANEGVTKPGTQDWYTPRTITEQTAVREVMSKASSGTVVSNVTLNDPRWQAKDGWVKMEQTVHSGNSDIVVHYVRNTQTGAIDDFKCRPITQPNK